MTMINRLSDLISRIVIAGVLLVICTTASAHTALKTSNPADGAVVNKAPEQLQLTFTASVALVKFSVTDSMDKQLEVDFTPSREPRTEYLMAIPQLPAGNYKVDWAVIGADGHTVANSFAFEIDPAAAHGHPGHGGDAGVGHPH